MKDRTVAVSGQMKDATVGASHWVGIAGAPPLGLTWPKGRPRKGVLPKGILPLHEDEGVVHNYEIDYDVCQILDYYTVGG